MNQTLEPETGEKEAIAAERRHLKTVSTALKVLSFLAACYTLYFARDFLLPLVLAVLVSFPLAGIVRALHRFRIPRALGAALVMISFVSLVGYAAYRVYGPAVDWMTRLPVQLRSVEYKLGALKNPVDEVSRAAERVEEGVEEIAGDGDEARPVEVVVERPALSDVLLTNTRRIGAMAVISLVLLYFLLASGDLFLLKVVRVLPKLEDKKRAVDISRQVEQDIAAYFLTVTVINSALGAAVASAFYFLGMPNPLLWGVLAGVLNFMPYLGALVGVVLIGLVALVSFDSPFEAFLAPTIYYGLTVIEGYFVTPTVLGRRLMLNPVGIFVSLIFWAWLWGIPGALLAVPILATIKIVCDEIEGLHPIAEFLGP